MSTSDPKLAAIEKSLTSLIPVPGRIDRDQLLFRAGQASVRTQPWLWPGATALLAVVSCALVTALALRPTPATLERVVYVRVLQSVDMPSEPTRSAIAPSSEVVSSIEDAGALWAGSGEYLQQRNQAIRWGVESLPPSPSMASSKETPTVESMLGLPEKKPEQLFLKF